MLLAQREHSRVELRRKLMPMARTDAGGDAAAAAARVEALLDWLEAHEYVSQERFVEDRLHARTARFGNRRIEQELAQHGVELDRDTRARLNESELARARQVWQRKYGHPPADAAERLRQMRFLAGRGFSAEVVRRVVSPRNSSE
jgi:regulatory protein